MDKFLSVVSRVMVSLIFILSGLSKLGSYNNTVRYMTLKGIPAAPLFLYASVLVEILGGLMVALGYKAKIGLFLLIAFLIPTTFVFHGNFSDKTEVFQFLKNLSIIGCLLFMIVNGPGKWALDKN